KSVAIVERKTVIGGVCINSGTIPSKTVREAVLYLSGYRMHGLYGASYTVKERITMEDLVFRTQHVVSHEIDVTRHQLMRNRVDVLTASASFIDAHSLRLTDDDSRGSREVSAANIVIATGTEVTREPGIEFDGRRIVTSDDILSLDQLPRSMAVVGAGVIGLE